ncbi:hypothetical protein [Nocardioides daeguensis]|uniref:Uncharacterized protein n=1 Tax=Nocardioides daeguensis TaxID=908359 RepID=A0ABP6W2U2_9ACTN|nr:hypothetical protein [Nocardioides daeguensis]MBV6727666.1 hypothetical protein [Nocardioides daeguensis]MCR1775138.1 hypothetical protein [Nocardioides daeguensis]
MTYDSTTRDRFRWAVTGVSGALAVTALVGTGAITGQAARQLHEQEAADQRRQAEELAAWRAEQAAYEAALAASAPTPAVVKQRPTRTRVTVRYVSGTGPSPVTVSSGSSGPASSGGRSGAPGGGTGAASGSGTPGGGTPAPPPPPPPPPASSGS